MPEMPTGLRVARGRPLANSTPPVTREALCMTRRSGGSELCRFDSSAHGFGSTITLVADVRCDVQCHGRETHDSRGARVQESCCCAARSDGLYLAALGLGRATRQRGEDCPVAPRSSCGYGQRKTTACRCDRCGALPHRRSQRGSRIGRYDAQASGSRAQAKFDNGLAVHVVVDSGRAHNRVRRLLRRRSRRPNNIHQGGLPESCLQQTVRLSPDRVRWSRASIGPFRDVRSDECLFGHSADSFRALRIEQR
jgi:hypothetical protein